MVSLSLANIFLVSHEDKKNVCFFYAKWEIRLARSDVKTCKLDNLDFVRFDAAEEISYISKGGINTLMPLLWMAVSTAYHAKEICKIQ